MLNERTNIRSIITLSFNDYNKCDTSRKKMTMKTIKYEEIKTPTTVAEFRENLKKYLLTTPDRSNNATLICRSRGKQNILIDEINSFTDLYELGVEMIIPTIHVDVKNITQSEITTHMFSREFSSVLNDDSRFPIYEMEKSEDCREYMFNHDPLFSTLDNQIMRSFYAKTFGKFSGYVLKELKEVA